MARYRQWRVNARTPSAGAPHPGRLIIAPALDAPHHRRRCRAALARSRGPRDVAVVDDSPGRGRRPSAPSRTLVVEAAPQSVVCAVVLGLARLRPLRSTSGDPQRQRRGGVEARRAQGCEHAELELAFEDGVRRCDATGRDSIARATYARDTPESANPRWPCDASGETKSLSGWLREPRERGETTPVTPRARVRIVHARFQLQAVGATRPSVPRGRAGNFAFRALR